MSGLPRSCLTAGAFPISIVDDENANEMSYGLLVAGLRPHGKLSVRAFVRHGESAFPAGGGSYSHGG